MVESSSQSIAVVEFLDKLDELVIIGHTHHRAEDLHAYVEVTGQKFVCLV